MSQAIVITSSRFTPESGRMLARGSPRLFAIPPTVRRNGLELKRSAASTTSSSVSERRRRIGSLTTGSSAGGRSNSPPRPRRRRRANGIVGAVGLPSFTQPWSSAISWQRGQTSTNSPSPSGENRVARSPISSVRSQIAHERATALRVMRIARL